MVSPFQTFGMNKFVFIDCENLSPDEAIKFLKEKNCLNLEIQIVCLLGANQNQNNWYPDLISKLDRNISVNIALVRISREGKKNDQLLDKILLFYAGIAFIQNSGAEYIILAKDKGYSDVVEQLKKTGMRISHEGINEKKPEKPKPAKPDDPLLNYCLEKIEKAKNGLPKKLDKLKKFIKNILNSKEAKKKYPDNSPNPDTIIKQLKEKKIIKLSGEKLEWLKQS